MALPNIYSRRRRAAEATGDDVYQYDFVPPRLRVQTALMIGEMVDSIYIGYSDRGILSDAVQLLRKEIGAGQLARAADEEAEFYLWFKSTSDVEEYLDAIEIVLACADYHESRSPAPSRGVSIFVSELNARMAEACFGYQIEGLSFVQINSLLVHSEVVVPALRLLSDPAYVAADQEFRDAHRELREGNYEDCIHDCSNAFESVLKVICAAKGWPVAAGDTAKKLLDNVFANGLIPAHMQTEFAGLRTILESGVPTVRNKTGGHGAGVQPRVIPKHIAEFQLHQTAAAILLLVEAAK